MLIYEAFNKTQGAHVRMPQPMAAEPTYASLEELDQKAIEAEAVLSKATGRVHIRPPSTRRASVNSPSPAPSDLMTRLMIYLMTHLTIHPLLTQTSRSGRRAQRQRVHMHLPLLSLSLNQTMTIIRTTVSPTRKTFLIISVSVLIIIISPIMNALLCVQYEITQVITALIVLTTTTSVASAMRAGTQCVNVHNMCRV